MDAPFVRSSQFLRHIRVGTAKYGYPACCAYAFAVDILYKREPARERGMVFGLEGNYVPCEECIKKAGNTWRPPNRQRRRYFPVDNNEPALLVCKSVDMLTEAQAQTTNSAKVDCEECGQKVWVVPRNLILKTAKNAKVVCYPCAIKLQEAELDKGEPIFIIPAKPTVDALQNR